jgi:drug/metabolite transporter (DMT)-like permease
MLYLILSILCSAALVIILRLFSTYNIKTEYGITFNYLVCCITGFFMIDDVTMLKQIPAWNGWWICLLLGFNFIFIFTMVGKSIKLNGIASTTIAYKLSFIIPTIVALLFYGDKLTVYKITGIVAALLAVFFITYEKSENEKDSEVKRVWLLPVLIFIGSGITDSVFNVIQRNYTPANFDHIVTVMVFLGAMLSGFLLYGFNKEMYKWKNVFAGIILGIPNYASLYFLLQALKQPAYKPSVLFPINNLGIVGISAIAGFLLFKETVSAKKLIGFTLAIISIVLIGFL